DGKRAYARVRAGERVELAARPVTVHEFSLLATVQTMSADGTPVTDIGVRIRCSSGTYVRALARDLGELLGVGGHLTALRRTHVGPFAVADAMELPAAGVEGQTLAEPSLLRLPEALAAAFPLRHADESEARALSFGRPIAASQSSGVTGVLGPDGRALALVENAGGHAKPIVVLAPA